MDAIAATPFSAEDFRCRAARREFVAHADDDYGDHRFNPDMRDLIVRHRSCAMRRC